jgi:hypothetical protein
MVIADFIRRATVPDRHLSYRWDEWGNEVFLAPVDEQLAARLQRLSQRANVALSSTTAEWIISRFASLVDLTEPLQCLEAAWVQQIDFQYSWDWDLDESWKGPVKGPIRMTIEQVSLAVEKRRDYMDPSSCTAELDKLARYLIPDPGPYILWRDRILLRFEELYTVDPEDQLGDPVPREATDRDFDFDLAETERLVNEFLQQVDYNDNPLLSTPDMMLEDDFDGTPYVFNLRADRQKRQDW